ncbi:MAG: hypothetical protein QW743_00010 [Candidatus Methanomethylicia archaeon]
MSVHQITELPKVLALLLVEQGSYTYIDKLAQSASKDLALYHIREALRDYHSLLSRGISNDEAKMTADTINFLKIENEIRDINETSSISGLREKLSFLSAQALAEAARIRTRSTYGIGLKILEFFNKKGISFTGVEDFRKAIMDQIKEISKSLNIVEEDISEIAENTSLLKSLLRRGEK